MIYLSWREIVNVRFQTGTYWDNGVISCTHVLVYFPYTNLKENVNIINFLSLVSMVITCRYCAATPFEIAFS
jgi:hypothetical protein